METPLLVIVIGIALALLVNYTLGILCVVIGLALLVWPSVRAAGPRRRL